MVKAVLSLIALGATLIICTWVIISVSPQSVTYNCMLSEISPDYPIAVKEACRKKIKNAD